MVKQPIPVNALCLQPFTAFDPNGVLLVCGTEPSQANPMTISWGMFGIMWGRPVMMVMVRHSRYTWDFIANNPDFTVNWMPEDWSDAVALCGRESGRNIDKFAATGMAAISATKVISPVIAESDLSLECRTIFRSEVMPELFVDQSVLDDCYGNGDFHGLFYGEIVAATGLEHFRVK